MALYYGNISTELYKYTRPIYIKETSGQDRSLVPIKLNLNASNFNFDLSREDGLDFRLTESSNGSGALFYWISYWNYDNKQATIWFKLPYIFANDRKEVWAFWGFPGDSGASDLSKLVDSDPVFEFADDFDSPVLDPALWSTSNGAVSVGDSLLTLGTDAYLTTQDILTYTSFIVEEGILGVSNPSSLTSYVYRYQFINGDNGFEIQYFWDDTIDRKHNFVSGGSLITYNGSGKGIEIGSYAHNYVAYEEASDTIYQGMANRSTLADYDDSWERQVHRNTTPMAFRIWGPDVAATAGVSIDWIVIRQYNDESEPTVDLTELYVDYEYVSHQPIDYTDYGDDVTDINFYHISDMGGDPYRLSDNVATGINNAFVSDDGITEGSIIIDFGRLSQRENSADYLHLNNNAVGFYNADKLSDTDVDENNITYWQATRTSNVWAAIKFPTRLTIATISVWAVPGATNKMIKNYNIYGCNSDPRFNGWSKKVLLKSGQFLASEDEQIVRLTNRTSYFYYILEAIDSYGENVALQEWAFYRRTPDIGKKVISQLRLRPVVDGTNEYYFPKQIKLQASNDSINWTTLIDTIDTATPFTDYIYGRWQRFSFDNYDAYYMYKLTCYDNWTPAYDQIKISEWEMVERAEEATTYRILEGSTSNINSVWTASGTGYDSGFFYVVNDYINTISDDVVIEYSTLSGLASDINVIGS